MPANGNGAALILDSAQIEVKGNGVPLILAKVAYGTKQQRINWLLDMANKAAGIISENAISSDLLPAVAHALFDRIKLFALFTKHIGFSEEREWRVVYMRDRDTAQHFDFMFGYHNGSRGMELKLKFQIKPIPGVTADDMSLKKIAAAIILGPTASSPLALAAVKRMVADKQPELVSLVTASTIPLRPS